MAVDNQPERWQEAGEYAEFFHEQHIEVSRKLDDEFRDWLADHTGHDDVERLDVRWSWDYAENDNRPITAAKVRW